MNENETRRQLAEDDEEHERLITHARLCQGRRDVHSVYEVLDQVPMLRKENAALVKERDHHREFAEKFQQSVGEAVTEAGNERKARFVVEAERDAMAEAYEKARAALKEYARAANWATVPGAGRTGSDFACAWIGPMGPCAADALAREALAAPAPDMEQWRRERELRDAAVELAEAELAFMRASSGSQVEADANSTLDEKREAYCALRRTSNVSMSMEE